MIDINFLIVDDIKTVRLLTRQAINSRLGAKKIFEAADGKEALEVMAREKIDIIISDWEMPVMSGEEFLYEIRNSKEHPEWNKVPFLMMSSHGEKDFIITAIQNGVSNYVVKPFTAIELQEKIRQVWSNATRRENERYYHFPEHNLALKVGGKIFHGKLVNLSRLGALVRIEYNPDLQLCRLFELAIEISDESAGQDTAQIFTVTNLLGLVTRLELENSFQPTSRTCLMGIWFGAKTVDLKVEKALNSMLQWLAKSSPDVIGND